MSEKRDLDNRKEIEERKRIKREKKRKRKESAVNNTEDDDVEANKLRNEIEERKRIKKEKKRTRRDKDHTDGETGSEKTLDQTDEIERNDDQNDSPKPKEPSKRQIKKERMEKKYAEQREAGKIEAAQKALNYISKWKHAKSDWKFEKLRQIWIMDHLLDENLIPDSIFPIAVEYFEGSKGMAREQLVKKAMQVIKKIEEEVDNVGKEGNEDNEDSEERDNAGSTSKTEYQRAREILQALPIDS